MDKPILWYFADPMCSWCWGFSPVITRIKETFSDRIAISLNLGGLRPGTVDPMSAELRSEILHHWHEVHHLTGQEFLFDNAMPEGFIYDTESASRAVLSFGKLQPENTLAYFASIQSAFYTQGLDVTQETPLVELAASFNVDSHAFHELFISEAMRSHTQEHFKRSYQANVRGFPTLIWQQGQTIETLSRGYVSWENIAAVLEQQLGNH